MKKSQFEIELAKLYELAQKFAKFGADNSFKLKNTAKIGTKPNHWDNDVITFREEGRTINLYFGEDYKSWSVNFGNLKITSWYNSVEIPVNTTVKEIREIYNDANALL
ncbi:MAG: hypothetical protein WC222_11480 [Parachlamydiales bacterium]|jgi:hypothetical protein